MGIVLIDHYLSKRCIKNQQRLLSSPKETTCTHVDKLDDTLRTLRSNHNIMLLRRLLILVP